MIRDKVYVNIYILPEEQNSVELLEELKKQRKLHKNVAVFTAGEKPFKSELIKALN